MRLALALLLVLLPGLAVAERVAERVAVRAGDHPGFGRLVFDWPVPPAYTLEQQGESVLLRFPPGTDLRPPRRLPRNLVALAAEAEVARLTLRPGARLRHYRLGGRVVVDLFDPPAVAARADPRPPSVPAVPVPPALVAPPVVAAAAPPTPEVPRVETPAAPPASLPPAAAPPARVLAGPHGPPGILLPFPAETAAAVLRRGDQVLAVFDSAVAPDLRPLLGDPVFGAIRSETLPGATLIRVPLAPPAELRARSEAGGWVLEAVRPPVGSGLPGQPMVLEAEPGPSPRLVLRAAAPGRVVPVTDPETGLPLLLGTLRRGEEATAIARRLPEIELPPTSLGAAVLARSDGIALIPSRDRFILSAAGGGRLALDAAALRPAVAAAMTRSFDLPAQATPELLARLQGLQAGIAGAPPLGRMSQRRAAGEALLALGLPQEAQAMLTLGFAEDPRAATDSRYGALAAAAALLSGRLAETEALRSPAWPDTDEATLWRAALAAAQGEWRLAGPGFAATLPLVLAYPGALRARLLPLAALALAEVGDGAALGQVLSAAGAAEELALPRAIQADSEGKAEEALAAYDRIAGGRDRLARARAIRRAVELRLATGKLDAGQAAKALEAALFAWRGDAQEIETRLRLAALRRAAGDGRGALALMRETVAMVPDSAAAALQPALRESFLAALAEAPPLPAVALFDAYPALLPPDAQGEAAVLLLVDRLLALDLGDRAATLLRAAMERAGGATRAVLGQRLASMRLDADDAAGALAALGDSAVEELPPATALGRGVLAARAEARRGRQAGAIAALRALGPAAGEALAEVLADSADWPGAAAALGAHLATTLPEAPAALDESQRRRVLRQAVLLALAGEEAGLGALRERHAARMGEGPLAEAFSVLTADPLRGLADLPRLQRELQLFRNLPRRLEALRAGGPVTR
ncbi:MAG: hypothetical protein ACOYOH_17195 [Paracraurococcus sp.]